MSGNTLELDIGVHWEAKNELNRLAFSFNFTVMKDWKNTRYLFVIEKPIEN